MGRNLPLIVHVSNAVIRCLSFRPTISTSLDSFMSNLWLPHILGQLMMRISSMTTMERISDRYHILTFSKFAGSSHFSSRRTGLPRGFDFSTSIWTNGASHFLPWLWMCNSLRYRFFHLRTVASFKSVKCLFCLKYRIAAALPCLAAYSPTMVVSLSVSIAYSSPVYHCPSLWHSQQG